MMVGMHLSGFLAENAWKARGVVPIAFLVPSELDYKYNSKTLRRTCIGKGVE